MMPVPSLKAAPEIWGQHIYSLIPSGTTASHRAHVTDLAAPQSSIATSLAPRQAITSLEGGNR
jgi:hypothetical protein